MAPALSASAQDDSVGFEERRLIALSAELDGPDVPLHATFGHIHSTWARTFSSLAAIYFQPESLEEIQKIIRLAHRARQRISVTGCAHSPSEITCTSSWLVNLDNFGRILTLDKQTGLVTMQAGIRLYALNEALEANGLAMRNLGSINDQSIAGAISTGTHGSSLLHGLLSEDVASLRIALADGSIRACSPTDDPDLFRAALLSLGALGVVVEVTFRAVPAFTLRWTQVIDSDSRMLAEWHGNLWKQARFVRVWWFPYTRRAVTWVARETDEPAQDLRPGLLARMKNAVIQTLHLNLMWLAHRAPRVLPLAERLVFGLQYGFRNGTSSTGVQQSRAALLMDCLYSQLVDEWAIPLEKGPEALSRLGAWLNHLQPGDEGYVEHKIPFSVEGMWVHAPVEVRVSDTSRKQDAKEQAEGRAAHSVRPFLDPTCQNGPTLFLNATMYRPYLMDPPGWERYYEGFEWLMRDLGGRPHWAKNFMDQDFEAMYGEDLRKWREVRDEADPQGMFVGPWHRRHVMGPGEAEKGRLECEEVEVSRGLDDKGGVRVVGKKGGQ